MARTAGRPRLASREMLQEAAFELFQLQGYHSTSVEQIAKTAGFSRATFFNFFTSKAELFWVETDALLCALGAHLEADAMQPAPETLREALLSFTEQLESTDVPWALQNIGLIEATDDLVASGASRVQEVNRMFVHYLQQSHAGAVAAPGSLALRAEAAATTAKLLVSLSEWIEQGVSRGALNTLLTQVL